MKLKREDAARAEADREERARRGVKKNGSWEE